jgi:hypothetical protein
MTFPNSRRIITSEDHFETLAEMKRIFARVSDSIIAFVGDEPKMVDVDHLGLMRRTTKFYAVWFLPGQIDDEPVTMINHGFHMILDHGFTSILKIKTWGNGWIIDSKISLPVDWIRVETLIMDTLPPIMRLELCSNCGNPMHAGTECADESRQWR